MIPTSLLIVTTTIFGTLTLRTVVSKQRQVIVESIENILEKCQHIDATMASANILAAESNFHVDYVPNVKCCDEMEKVKYSHHPSSGFQCFYLRQVCENDLKSVDFYDSKFDLGALSIADLSLQSSSDVQDFAEFKRAIKFSLFFQPAFTVCWFLGVVALENRQSCVMPIIFIVCYNLLVWTLIFRRKEYAFHFRFIPNRIGTPCIAFRTLARSLRPHSRAPTPTQNSPPKTSTSWTAVTASATR